jgi:prolyl oligopeptidase
VEFEAGHGIGSTRTQSDNEYADAFAFIFWQSGDGRYQVKA